MYVVIRDASGETFEGIALATGKDRMRVALRSGYDVVELRRSYTQWLNEAGDFIELDAILSDQEGTASYAGMFAMSATV